MDKIKKEILEFMPEYAKSIFYGIKENIWNVLEEIRIYRTGYIFIRYNNKNICLNEHSPIMQQNFVDDIFLRITDFSPFSFNYHVTKGYITTHGGHRVGISGKFVTENEKILSVKEISCLNIRIAREIECFGKDISKTIYNSGKILNTLIISPPKCGKTTLIRNISKYISKEAENPCVAIVDERGEVCGCENGQPCFSFGNNVCIIEDCSKKNAIQFLIKSMSPEVITCDEVSSDEDISAIEYAMLAGVPVVFSMHGKDFNQIKNTIPSRVLRGINYIVEISSRLKVGTIENERRINVDT